MPDNALTANLRRDRRKAATNPAEHLTQDEFGSRAVEVSRVHHEPCAEHVDNDTGDTDPPVPLRVFRGEAGDDSRDGGRENV